MSDLVRSHAHARARESLLEVGDALNLIAAPPKPPSSALSTFLGLTATERRAYSLGHAISVMAQGPAAWSRYRGIEKECDEALTARLGGLECGLAIRVPADVQTRADLVGTPSLGGYLVSTMNLGFIDALRARTISFRLGAQLIDCLVSNVNIPKQTGSATQQWLTVETQQATESDQSFGQLALSPNVSATLTYYSTTLLKQSAPAIERVVMNNHSRVQGVAIDTAVLSSGGFAGAPHGILNLTGSDSRSRASYRNATALAQQAAILCECARR